jgi:hypothetical protein
MKLDEIYELWSEDSYIDPTELSKESLHTSKLHHKYMKIYSSERMILLKLESEMKILKKEKFEFFTMGPTKETQEKGWILPPKGTIVKIEVPMYIDADKDIIDMSLRIGYQKEKVDTVESILKNLHNRGYAVKNAIDWHKFINGSNNGG